MKRTISLFLICILIFTHSPAKADIHVLQERYEAALLLVQEERYAEAREAFVELGNYEDSSQNALYCSAIVAAEAKDYSVATTNLRSLGDFRDSRLLSLYYQGCAYEEDGLYDEAKEIFLSISLYKDSGVRIKNYPDQTREGKLYAKALAYEKENEWINALKIYESIKNYKDCLRRSEKMEELINEDHYQRAVAFETDGKFQEALSIFEELNDYSDSESRAQQIRERLIDDTYHHALALQKDGKLEQALAEFEKTADYRDSAVYITAIQAELTEKHYQTALALEQKNDAKAYDLYVSMGDYKDCQQRAEKLYLSANYEKGMDCIARGSYNVACALFEELGDYQDSNEKAYLLSLHHVVEFETFEEGIVFFEFHGRYGMIDFYRNQLISPRWFDYKILAHNRAAVKTEEKWQVIDEASNSIGGEWDYISPFDNGMCLVADYISNNKQADKCLFGLMNVDGQLIADCQYKQIGDFSLEKKSHFKYSDAYIVQTTNQKWGVLSGDGRLIINPEYDSISIHENNCYYVIRNKKFGLINYNGTIWIPAEYDEIDKLINGFVRVRKNTKWGYYNRQGEMIVPCRYSNAEPFDERGWAQVQLSKDGNWDIIDASAKKIFFTDIHTYNLALEKMEQKSFEEAIELLSSIDENSDVIELLKECKYLLAQEKINAQQYVEAYQLLEVLGEYRDSREKMLENKYERANILAQKGEYEQAIALYVQIGEYKNANELAKHYQYTLAQNELEQGNLYIAYEKFVALENYLDCEMIVSELIQQNIAEIFSALQPGDCLQWGSYHHNDTDKKEPITWLVLEREKDALLLIAKEYLDYKFYHSSQNPITWADSSLRKWLNGEFYKESFSNEEKSRILSTQNNTLSLRNNTEGGKSTKDKVFLLTAQDFAKYKKILAESVPSFTEWISEIEKPSFQAFWLRNPGRDQGSAASFTWTNNPIYYPDGYAVKTNLYVSPVIRLSLTNKK